MRLRHGGVDGPHTRNIKSMAYMRTP